MIAAAAPIAATAHVLLGPPLPAEPEPGPNGEAPAGDGAPCSRSLPAGKKMRFFPPSIREGKQRCISNKEKRRAFPRPFFCRSKPMRSASGPRFYKKAPADRAEIPPESSGSSFLGDRNGKAAECPMGKLRRGKKTGRQGTILRIWQTVPMRALGLPFAPPPGFAGGIFPCIA